MPLLYPEDVDQELNWPLGRAEHLARQRRLPYVLLPDGSIRFRWEQIEPLILYVLSSPTNSADRQDVDREATDATSAIPNMTKGNTVINPQLPSDLLIELLTTKGKDS